MFILDRLFSQKSQPQKPTKGLFIYINNELKRNIQTHNQTASQYMNQNQFDQDQFLYLLLKNKKTDQIYSKRKLNPYQWFTDCMENVPQELKAYIIIGYTSQRNSFPKINSNLPISDNPKCIRSGNLLVYSDTKNIFEQCQLRLHHDYLTYYKIKAKQKKVSFMPLQNSIVQAMNQNKYVFIVKDKFKNLLFRTTSKQDTIGWLLAISDAIKIRSSQIYLNQFDQRLAKTIKEKMTSYFNKCMGLKQQSKIILVDDIGRKAIKNYFKKHPPEETDLKMLKIIQSYLQMCKLRKQKGQAHSQNIINEIKESIKQLFALIPQILKPRQLVSNHQFIKIIEQIMKYLDSKYKKEIIDKKYLNYSFQHHLTDQYKEKSQIPIKSLFGSVKIKSQKDKDQSQRETQKQFTLSLSIRSQSKSPMKKSMMYF